MAFRGGGGGAAGDADQRLDMVKQFAVYFYRHIREKNVEQILSMYEVTFNKISDRMFQGQPWPPATMIMKLVDDDDVFRVLYNELYFRHLYARCFVSLQARMDSWDNYEELFGLVLQKNVNMQLPLEWLWDMVDEFVYQFQSFSQYRGKLAQKAPEELEQLRLSEQRGEVWNVLRVLNILQAVVDKSGIVSELQHDGGELLFTTKGLIPGQTNMPRLLGYFSLIGLMRVHTLMGDYHSALKALHPLNPMITNNLLTTHVPGANITLYYYSGFCYLMMRRYTDAAKCFNTVLTYISHIKQYHQRSANYEQILKKNEQMYALLAMVVSICPAAQRVLGEHVTNSLGEKYGERVRKMTSGDFAMFDELFTFGCPKFITASPTPFDTPTVNVNQEAYRAQLKLFLDEVKQHAALPSLKSYLKLYTSVPLRKLAVMMETDVAVVRNHLMALKQKSVVVQWNGKPSALSGEPVALADVDFHLDADAETGEEVVVINDMKQQRSHVQYLARHIKKFQDIIRDLEKPPVAAPRQQSGMLAA